MQHALLGFAIALILAIVAAIAAPAYINWNDWRAAFEDRATALVGAPVRIRGRIEASLLPTPAFVFRDVAIGDPDKGTGVRVGEVRGILSLGPLLRGVLEAEEFVLARPAVRVTSEGSGKPALRSLLATARATGIVALARVSVERGSLVIDDRTTGEVTIFDEITADGELRARDGPLRVDATFLRDGRRWSLRTSTGRFGGEGSGRVRLALERIGDGTQFDADGMLSLANGSPRFDGKVSASRKRGPSLPWQVNANAKAGEQSVAIDGFALTVGASAAPIDLTGQIEFEPRRGGRIDGSLSALRVDLDLVSGGEASKGMPGAAAALRDVFALLNDLPLQGRLEVAAESVVAGGGTVRDARAELALRENSLALNALEARLPGRGTLTASGASSGSAIFNGTAAIEAEDASALLRWAFAEAAPALPESGPLRLAGKVDWTNSEIAAEEVEFALGEAKLGCRIHATPGNGKRRAQIEAEISASGVDLDRFVPFAQAARGWTEGADLTLALDGRDLRAFGRTLARVDASVSRAGDALAIERFIVDDFEGLSGLARGRIAGSFEQPSGRVDFELESRRPEGLAAIVLPLLGGEAARAVSVIAGTERPLRLYGAALGAGAAAGLEVNASGYLAEVELNVAAHFDTLARSLSEARVQLEAGDAGKLVSLLGLKPGLPVAGEATFEVLFAKPEEVLPVTARLSVPGAKLAAEGELRKGAEGRIEPRLDLRLEADDLRPLLSAAARSAGDAAIPGQGSARLSRKGDAFMLEAIDLRLAGSGVKGGLTIGRTEETSISGNLSIERARAATLLALLVGSTSEGKALWPASRLDPPAVAAASGKIELGVKELGFAEGLAATGTRFNVRLGANETSIEEFSAELAGGKVTGSARFVRGAQLGFDGRASLSSFSAERLLAPLGSPESVRGRGNLTLAIAGSGDTPAAVVGSLAGQGTLALEPLEIDRLDPNAVSAVLAIPEQSEPRDEAGVVAALAPALARGPLRIAKIDSPIVIASGVARTGRARTQAGPAQVTAEGTIDLAKLVFEAAVEIETPPPAGLTMRPAATVRWRGPLAAPERSIDVAALATAITLRAMERETKRIEQRDRALPKRSAPALPTIEAQPLATRAQEQESATATVPETVPAARVPPPPARPRGNPPAATALPPLSPPVEIRPAPGVFGQP